MHARIQVLACDPVNITVTFIFAWPYQIYFPPSWSAPPSFRVCVQKMHKLLVSKIKLVGPNTRLLEIFVAKHGIRKIRVSSGHKTANVSFRTQSVHCRRTWRTPSRRPESCLRQWRRDPTCRRSSQVFTVLSTRTCNWWTEQWRSTCSAWASGAPSGWATLSSGTSQGKTSLLSPLSVSQYYLSVIFHTHKIRPAQPGSHHRTQQTLMVPDGKSFPTDILALLNFSD